MQLLGVLSDKNKSSFIRLCFVTYLSLTVVTVSEGQITGLIAQVAKFGGNLKNNLDNDEITDFEDVTTAIFRNLPFIGQLWESTSKNSFEELSQKLVDLSNKLKRIENSIQIAIIQKQVAENAREIDNCFEDYTRLLGKPENPLYLRRLRKCQNNVKYGRNIGDILTGKKITFKQDSIFQEIISRKGYCDGKEITDVFKHVYGLYVKACASISMSEYLNSNNFQHTYNEECIEVNSKIFKNLQNVYLDCQSRDSCSKKDNGTKIQNIVKSLIKEHKFSYKTFTSLSEHFPWYFFTLLETKDELKKKTFLGSDKVPSRITIKVEYNGQSDEKFVTVIWFPVKNNEDLTRNVSSNYELLLYQGYRWFDGINFTLDENTHGRYDYTYKISGLYLKSERRVEAFTSCNSNPTSNTLIDIIIIVIAVFFQYYRCCFYIWLY